MSKRYARFLTAVFCLFLGGLMVWQMLLPDRERSDVENRTLQQRPALTLSSVLDGSYMEDVEAYVQDQFPLRDQWTGLKARTEQLIGKRLFNNIYLCEGETLISKVDAPADGLEKANLNYVSQLAEKSDIPMYLGLIPSAAEVWRDKLPEGAESWDQNAYLAQAAGLGLPMIDFSAALTAHADEPIFYRTDHHWTSLGAFYGANALLEVLGRESLKQESFTPEIASTSFNVTLYSQSGIHWLTPDTMEFWVKEDGLTVTSWRTGSPEPAALYDRRYREKKDKYPSFLGGNQPLCVLKNEHNPDGGKILLVRENCGAWSMPGGWVDVDLSVGESTIKEVKEEAGLDVTADQIIAVQDREKHNRPIYAYKICKIFVLCTVTGGSFTENPETTESRYFGLDELPVLAEEKNTAEQIRMCFDAYRADDWKTLFD